MIEQWRKEYDEVPPHGSFGNPGAGEFVRNLQPMRTLEAKLLNLRVV